MNYEVRIYEDGHLQGTSDHYQLEDAQVHCQAVIIGLGSDRQYYRQDIIDKSTRKVIEVVK